MGVVAGSLQYGPYHAHLSVLTPLWDALPLSEVD